MAQVIRASGAAVVGLQEKRHVFASGEHQFSDLRSRLSDLYPYFHYQPAHVYHDSEEGLAVLSRVAFESPSHLRLPLLAGDPDQNTRIVLRVPLRDAAAPALQAEQHLRWVLFVTHLSYTRDPQTMQLQAVRAYVDSDAVAAAQVLVGDLNTYADFEAPLSCLTSNCDVVTRDPSDSDSSTPEHMTQSSRTQRQGTLPHFTSLQHPALTYSSFAPANPADHIFFRYFDKHATSTSLSRVSCVLRGLQGQLVGLADSAATCASDHAGVLGTIVAECGSGGASGAQRADTDR